MSQWNPPRSAEIDRKLRDDFRRLLKEYGSVPQETDPLLAVLFRSFATQIAEVYGQAAETIPAAILDELIDGVGLPPRQARPAQTVVRFGLREGRERLEAGTELLAEAASKEKLTFALDNALEVSTASISLVAIYQSNTLRLHQGTELAAALEQARPSFDAVAADLGPSPAIFIAVDVDPAVHLNHHSFFFELNPQAENLLACLQHETWCLLDQDGRVGADGLLRPWAGNGGIRNLTWLTQEEATNALHESCLLPEGFFGSRVFRFPAVPAERRFLTTIPQQMEAPLKRMFQQAPSFGALFARPRAWLRIALPQTMTTVAEDLLRIVLHGMTASNVEVLNQKIVFADMGTAIPIGNSGRRQRFLVREISLKGEQGAEYLPEVAPNVDEFSGRYRFRQGCLEIQPARNDRGTPDTNVNARLLLTNGNLKRDKSKVAGESEVAVGAIKTFLNRMTPRTLEIRNITAAEGGTDGESYRDARQRFAEALLTRDRLVTQLDLEAAAKSFDHRIQSARVHSALERSPAGLQRVQCVTIGLAADSFTLSAEEGKILQTELASLLQRRALMGMEIRVKMEWV